METYTAERKYHGYVIKTCTQDSGRKTYDVYEADGVTEVEWACESLAIAKATVDAAIEMKEWIAAVDEQREDLGQLEARELWVCSYCEHLAEGGEEDEAGSSEADMFFQIYAAPDYSITLVGELRAGEDSEVTGVCGVCSSLDGLREIELSRIGY